MIGRFRFPCRRGTAEARLDDRGRWHCDEVPALVRVLEARYSPRSDEPHPADPGAAQHHLAAAASWLHGTIV